MCTVTFVSKGKDDFILTSNRDELPQRKTLPPQETLVGDTKLLYPKDAVAGGTWVGVSEKKRMINLLNGAFEPHERKATYRLSRGVVVKDLLVVDNVLEAIDEYDFSGVEPFTIILADWSNGLKLYTLVWDEKQKHFNELAAGNYIWNSSPLYSNFMKSKREKWFGDFISKNDLNADSLKTFHQTAGDGDAETSLIMNRGFIKTVSITQIEKKGNNVKMHYEDIQTKEFFSKEMKWVV